jgi:dTDP-4-dehydrorhamnose 3,5-epimerase
MPFEFERLEINEITLIKPRVFYDERGFFMETFKDSDFRYAGIDYDFKQDNHSYSKKNVIRALHYQLPPKEQGKLVRVISGRIFDVAVDIRKESPTYLKWVGAELSDINNHMLFIPPGFAHGFSVLSDKVHLLYKCTEEYDSSLEKGIRWDDPKINVDWKIENPIVSHRDRNLPNIK